MQEILHNLKTLTKMEYLDAGMLVYRHFTNLRYFYLIFNFSSKALNNPNKSTTPNGVIIKFAKNILI